jgi:hypothetical protein
MKRRINHTGRRKINAENVLIRIVDGAAPGDAKRFTASITLPPQLRLDPGASIYVEPYVKTSSMRFPFGRVGSITQPADTQLTELDLAGGVLFRVRVVDEKGDIGRIVAAADEIRPRNESEEGDDRRSLLPLVLADLREQVWNVSIEPGAVPVLQINNRIPGLRERLFEDPVVQGAIYPQALRQVLTFILKDDPGDDDTVWVEDWKTFTAELLKRPFPEHLDPEEDDSEIEMLVDEAVEAYCATYVFATTARTRAEGLFL